MVYLSWSTGYTGIFASQVIDVLHYINAAESCNTKLVCFVPYKDYFETRRTIMVHYRNSIILPMVPSRNRWWRLYVPVLSLVFLFGGKRRVIARGVIACNLALALKEAGRVKWVCYDGRGAVKAEWTEYDVVNDKALEGSIARLEQDAVLKSNFRIAVSTKLIEYWQKEYAYRAEGHVVIPCTISGGVFKGKLDSSYLAARREKLGYTHEDIVITFSGGVDHWQSFSELDKLLIELIAANSNTKILLLSSLEMTRLQAFRLYKERISQFWVQPDEVASLLSVCDYGILYRHSSVTNFVAAPTKFAEYLACGLKVIISPDIGDYSSLVEEHDLGTVLYRIDQPIPLARVELAEKNRMVDYALKHLTKEAYGEQYRKMIQNSFSV